MNKKERIEEKKAFSTALTEFVAGLGGYVSADDGQWTVKGFIDVFKNIYTSSSDTKIISKILEIHFFPDSSVCSRQRILHRTGRTPELVS